MTKAALYVVGQPGAGKSTLVTALTDGWPYQEFAKPVAHSLISGPNVVELGRHREDFPGTDTLAMSAIAKVDPWVRDIFFPTNLLLGEGDRLAVGRFFTALLEGGWDLCIAHLYVPDEVAAARREARGGGQNASWVKGRITKVQRLVEEWDSYVVTLDGTAPLEKSLAQLRQSSPVADMLLVGSPC